MKTGSTLPELAQQLQTLRDAKADYLAETPRLRFQAHPGGSGEAAGVRLLGLPDLNAAPVRAIAHAHFAELTGIPKRYYDRMATDAPDLLAVNLNHWLASGSKRRLVRTISGEVRAVLSDRYRPMENEDFVAAVLPALAQHGGEVRSCQLTESKLFVKLVHPGLREEILAPGHRMGQGHDPVDIVEAGLVLTNSEVGFGRLAIQPALHTRGCTNLAVWRENTLAKTHVGAALSGDGEESEVQRYVSDETKRKQDDALWATVRDTALAALDGRIFRDTVAKVRQARDLALEGPVAEVVQKVAGGLGLNETEQAGVLDFLVKGGDLTAYGLHAAVTRYAQDVEDYARASELEVLGADVVTLPAREFHVLAS